LGEESWRGMRERNGEEKWIPLEMENKDVARGGCGGDRIARVGGNEQIFLYIIIIKII
jgi:hypothetical protein